MMNITKEEIFDFFTKVEKLQSEMHNFIDQVIEFARTTNRIDIINNPGSYDAIKDLYYLWKFTQIQEEINLIKNKISGPINKVDEHNSDRSNFVGPNYHEFKF